MIVYLNQFHIEVYREQRRLQEFYAEIKKLVLSNNISIISSTV